ncbi:hypothetical protein GCM10017600_06040 [Streptosporangium carneum]|uniref:Uncharacterized protein n=2 Tax=Streptosporangium carneum TaxID=47481 RepID=A0A9W6HWY8_9ACTN|nr:hypothetical protein GCM10017600_06040 [Streptosporangium carneum]
MIRLRKAVKGFAFTMAIGLVGFGVIFGVSALFDLPWLVDVLGSGSMPLVMGLLVLLGPVAFVAWSVRKIGGRRRRRSS